MENIDVAMCVEDNLCQSSSDDDNFLTVVLWKSCSFHEMLEKLYLLLKIEQYNDLFKSDAQCTIVGGVYSFALSLAQFQNERTIGKLKNS